MSRSTGKMMNQVNEFKAKMMAELPVEELSEVTRSVPRLPTSPQQAIKMLVTEEKPEAAKQVSMQPEVSKQEPVMQEPTKEG